jgi:alpha-methylacyl-CoA racemase
VLTVAEAPGHPHNQARGAFLPLDGVMQPGPSPRFSRTPAEAPTPPDIPGGSSRAILAGWGFPEDRIAALERSGIVRQSGRSSTEAH